MADATQQVIDLFGGAVVPAAQGVTVRDAAKLRSAATDRLVWQAVFGSGDEREAALKGVVGLLFSSRHDDPVLLELLAHTLVDPNVSWRSNELERQRAARAYLKAADASVRPDVAEAYRGRAAAVLEPLR